jgi:hypothetical protein
VGATKVGICNVGLMHLGIGKVIASIDSDQTEEARAMRLVYDQARDEVFRDFAWPFATKIAALAKVADDPNAEWDFAYRYPADAVDFRRILSGYGRSETNETRVPYRLSMDSGGMLILTDAVDAEGEWTTVVVDAPLYPPDFAAALSLLLAHYCAPRLTGGDPTKLGVRALLLYREQIIRAQVNAANEEQADLPPEADLIRARA